MCWQKIRRDRVRLLLKRKNKADQELDARVELKKALVRSAIEFAISHSGKIAALVSIMFIYITEWYDDRIAKK